MRKVKDYLMDINELAGKSDAIKHLSQDDILKLYQIVVQENEAWDGEFVSPEYVVSLMSERYQHLGLTPSRN